MKTLVINTYAGSILLGAKARGDEVIASLEDKGYGVPIQRENFPDLEIYAKHEDWPTMDLSDTVVIGHPPCAAFSSQNRGSAAVRGAGAAAFQCTINLLRYAMRNHAKAVTVESVVGAMEGGRQVHDQIAHEYGYVPYRVLINACSFGVPQFRSRFWIIFMPKGKNDMTFVLNPKRKIVGDVIANSVGKTLTEVGWVKKVTEEQLSRLRLLLEPEELNKFFEMSGSVVRNLPRFIKSEGLDIEEVRVRYAMGHNYTSHSMVVLAPGDLAPTLMAGSWWYIKDRSLAVEEYKEIMGFPRDYIFPGKFYQDRLREFLSRGVCPPTATWILDQVDANLNGSKNTSNSNTVIKNITVGQIADFRVQRRPKAVVS